MILISYRLLKVTLAHGCFSRFSNRTKSNKSHRASQLNQSFKKIHERHWGKLTQERKAKNIKTLVFCCIWTSYALHMNFLVHPLANKTR